MLGYVGTNGHVTGLDLLPLSCKEHVLDMVVDKVSGRPRVMRYIVYSGSVYNIKFYGGFCKRFSGRSNTKNLSPSRRLRF